MSKTAREIVLGDTEPTQIVEFNSEYQKEAVIYAMENPGAKVGEICYKVGIPVLGQSASYDYTCNVLRAASRAHYRRFTSDQGQEAATAD